MKVLHVLDHSIPLHSGYTFRTKAILEQQRAFGWETHHITSPKHGLAAKGDALVEEVDGLCFYRTPVPTGLMSRLPMLDQLAIIHALTDRLSEVVQSLRPDIIHAHSPALNGKAAVQVGRRFGIPVVYEIRAFWEDAAVDHGTSTEWGLRYRLTRALETSVVKAADAVTTICEGLRGDLLARGVPADKITVIPNAVDIDSFSADATPDEALRTRLGLEGKVVLGFIGSFYAYEGLPLLLDALPAIRRVNPEVRVLLVGGGPQEPLIREKVTAMGLTDQVIFTGRVPHSQVQDYYNLVDLFTYPRLPMRLTDLVTPLKPLEAMAQKRLVIASDVGGHKELIRHGENGWLFKAGDADELSRCVLETLAARAAWPAVREAGRQYVETERNWRVSVERYRPVYGRLIQQDV